MSEMVEIMRAGEWFELVFARCSSGYINVFSVERDTNRPHVDWAPVSDPQMLGDAAEARAADSDVWYGVATRTERLANGKRGGAEDCALLPVLFADLDVAGPRHKVNDRLPKSIDEAMVLLRTFPVRPSALVYTGGGLQPYWFLKEPLPADAARAALTRWGHTWKSLAAELDLHVDAVFNVDRVLRVPGTKNRKCEPVAVYARAFPDRLYTFAEVDGYLISPPQREARRNGGGLVSGDRPGDVFNAVHSAADVLSVRGFVSVRRDVDGDEHWSWPQSEGATSATVYAEDGHTTIWSETFCSQYPATEVRRPYDPFGLLAAVFFDGDHHRAGQALVDHGYLEGRVTDLSWLATAEGAGHRSGSDGQDAGAGDGSAADRGKRPNDGPQERPADWPKPMPLTGPEAGPSFDVGWLPKVVRDHVVELSRETQTPPAMAAFFDLGVIGAVLAKKVRVRIFGGWSEPPTIYSCVVAAVGERKTAVHEAATAPLETLEAELLADWEERKAEREAERAQLKAAGNKAEAAAVEIPPEPRLMAADATMEALAPLMRDNGGRMALITDEGASVFEILAGRYADRPSIELFLKGHDGKGAARIDRVGRNVVIRRPLLTCVLAVQPNVLTAVTSTMLGRGAPARFLYAVTATQKGRRDLKPKPMSEAVADAWSHLVVHLGRFEVPALEVTVGLSREADALFHDFRVWHEHESRSEGRLTQVDDWATKLPGAVARLALILHVAGRRPDSLSAIPPVSGEAMVSAVKIAHWLVEHAEVAYGCFDANPDVHLARRIAGWLRRTPRERFHRRDVCRATRKQIEEVLPALEILVEHDLICPVIDPKMRVRPLKDVKEYWVSPRLGELDEVYDEEGRPHSTSSTPSTDAERQPENVEEVEHVESPRDFSEPDDVEDVEDVEGGGLGEERGAPSGAWTHQSVNGTPENSDSTAAVKREKGFL